MNFSAISNNPHDLGHVLKIEPPPNQISNARHSRSIKTGTGKNQ